MKTETENYPPESPEDLRRLANEFREMPGWWSRTEGCNWCFSVQSICHLLVLAGGAGWWQEAVAVCPDRNRIAILAGAYFGECLRRNRRLRGKWVNCDKSDCPERAECPRWRVRVATKDKTNCVFRGFLMKATEFGAPAIVEGEKNTTTNEEVM